MKICVLGLGYIGLPTALLFASRGLEVHGVDVAEELVAKLNNRILPFEEPGMAQLFKEVMETKVFTASLEPCEADAFILSVPTPLAKNRQADLSFVKSAAGMICPYLKKGNLVILESTVPPGTVEEVLVPIVNNSGLKAGEEILIAHSPERVIPGNLLSEMVENDRIIGGINEKSANMAAHLYRRIVKGAIHTTDATTAEMVKLMENTFRDVNIALANEFALIAEKIGFDIWEAISLANHHPRVNIHSPGPGVGGHCIAVDPWFIVEKAPEEARLARHARLINEHMPYHVVKKILSAVNGIQSPNVSLLGVTYKRDVDDIRESPSFKVIQLLREANIPFKVFDPKARNGILPEQVSSMEEVLKDTDCCVILTDHTFFKELDWGCYYGYFRNPLILDTRNLLKADEMKKTGFKLKRLGTL